MELKLISTEHRGNLRVERYDPYDGTELVCVRDDTEKLIFASYDRDEVDAWVDDKSVWKRYAVYDPEDGKVIRLSNGTDEKDLLKEYEGSHYLVAEITRPNQDVNPTTLKLTATQWYSSEGSFEMTVTDTDLDTAVKMFGAALGVEGDTFKSSIAPVPQPPSQPPTKTDEECPVSMKEILQAKFKPMKDADYDGFAGIQGTGYIAEFGPYVITFDDAAAPDESVISIIEGDGHEWIISFETKRL